MTHKPNQDCTTSVTIFTTGATTDAPVEVDRFVSLNDSAKCGLTAAGALADFVTLETSESEGQAVQGSLPTGAINKVTSGGVIALGAKIASDATGRAVTAVAGDIVNGVAVTAAAQEGTKVGFSFAYKGTVA